MYKMLDIGDVVNASDIAAVPTQGVHAPYICWRRVADADVGETVKVSPCNIMRRIDVDLAELKSLAQKFRLDTDGKDRCTLDDLETAAVFLTKLAGEDYVSKSLLGV